MRSEATVRSASRSAFALLLGILLGAAWLRSTAAAGGEQGVPPPPGGLAAGSPAGVAQRQARVSAELDLVWLLAGIMDMERDKKLALAREQAVEVWAQFGALVEKGFVSLEADEARLDMAMLRGRPGLGAELAVRQQAGEFEELRRAREQREQAIHQAIEEMEKSLSPKQIAYVDNFDFDPERYGLGGRLIVEGAGPAVPGQGLAQGQGARPSQEEIRRFTEKARENARKLAEFYRGFWAFIRKKAGIAS